MAAEESRVDLRVIAKCMETCLQDDKVHLPSYVEAYQGLHRFFCRMGNVFGFVGSEVSTKLTILDKHMQSDQNGHHYVTVESMLAFEKQSDWLPSGKEPSGARTLLRLHRAMAFINKLLGRFLDLKDDENTGPSAKGAYKETLERFHTWPVRKGALAAMYFLPDLQGLVKKTTIHTTDEFRLISKHLVECGERVYEATQGLYSKYGCLDLP